MILMVDNYDSFTYNLVQMLSAAGAEVEVLRNDVESAEAMLAREPSGVVLSPGPGRPEEAGVCLDLLCRRVPVPLLGVCLGHQALGVAFGATVDRAPRLMHGKTSPVRHRDVGSSPGSPTRSRPRATIVWRSRRAPFPPSSSPSPGPTTARSWGCATGISPTGACSSTRSRC